MIEAKIGGLLVALAGMQVLPCKTKNCLILASMELLIYILVILASAALVWKGGGMLEEASERLSTYYRLSPVVQGSIVAAVGSSFPELSTTIISTLVHGEFDLGVSAIVGSAIFNILVIPGLSAVMAKRVESNWMFVVKDVQFYITSVVTLMLVFALAVVFHPVEGTDKLGLMTREIALLPIVLYALYLLLQQQETKTYRKDQKQQQEGLGIEALPKGNLGKIWLQFFISLVLIVISVEGLVRGAIFLGEYFNTANFVWGVIVLAAATSVPDAVVSVKSAMNNQGLISLANVIGSNIFDLLIAVPVGVLIAGSSVVNFSVASPLMIFLGFATLLLVVLLLRKSSLSRGEGWILLATYLGFIIWILWRELG